ncbi:hypothetical protein FRB99_004396, partial [Tulasnella sp. 403]
RTEYYKGQVLALSEAIQDLWVLISGDGERNCRDAAQCVQAAKGPLEPLNGISVQILHEYMTRLVSTEHQTLHYLEQLGGHFKDT